MPKTKGLNCKGVTLNKRRNRWEVQIIFKKKRYYLGSYKNRKVARAVFLCKQEEFYGNKKIQDLDGEIWLHIKTHPGQYYVSNRGRVKNINYEGRAIERLLKQHDSHGYKMVLINRVKCFVHKIEAQCFLGDTDLFVNHKDGNKSNNEIDNLEYVTYRSNICHRYFVVENRGIPIGAHFHKTNKVWQSEINIDGKLKYLGSFNTKEEAHGEYLIALLEHGLIDDYNYLIAMDKNTVKK